MVSAKRKGLEGGHDSASHQQEKAPGRNRGAKKQKTLSSPPAQTASAGTDDFVLPQVQASVASSDQAWQAPETPTKQSSKLWTNELRITLLLTVLKELDHPISGQTWRKVAESLKPKKPSISWNGARFEVARLMREHFPSTASAPSDQHDQPAETVKDEKDED